MLHIGDNYENDYLGATYCQIPSLLIERIHSVNKTPAPDNRIIYDLNQVFEHL